MFGLNLARLRLNFARLRLVLRSLARLVLQSLARFVRKVGQVAQVVNGRKGLLARLQGATLGRLGLVAVEEEKTEKQKKKKRKKKT